MGSHHDDGHHFIIKADPEVKYFLEKRKDEIESYTTITKYFTDFYEVKWKHDDTNSDDRPDTDGESDEQPDPGDDEDNSDDDA